MQNGFFLGVYPGITHKKIDYIVECIAKFVKEN
jgi:dTDP-4-amino-4,6-dideoxygalactose transaminase